MVTAGRALPDLANTARRKPTVVGIRSVNGRWIHDIRPFRVVDASRLGVVRRSPIVPQLRTGDVEITHELAGATTKQKRR